MTRTMISIGTYVVELLIAFLYFENIFEPKRSRLNALAWGFGFYSVGALQFILLYNPILNFIISVVRNILFVFCAFRAKPLKGLLSSLLYDGIVSISEFIALQLLSAVTTEEFDQYMKSDILFLIAVLLSKTLLLLICIPIARFLRGNSETKSEIRTPLFLFVFPLSIILMHISIWKIGQGIDPSRPSSVLLVISSTMMVASVLLIYAFYGTSLRRSRELYQLQHEYETIQTDQEYYRLLDHQHAEMRTLIHDEKNHLAAIKAMQSTDEIRSYVDKVLGDLAQSTPIGNTQNRMLDLVLGRYVYACSLKGIRFEYATLSANLSFMDDNDLVSLVSNILDNAVEAAEQAEDKWIDFSVESKVAGMTILTCRNASDRPPITQNGRLLTTKENSAHHGIGVKSIRRTARKYKAAYEWSWDKVQKAFTAQVIFEQ